MSDTTEPITTTTEPTVTEPSQLDPFAPEPEPIPEPPYTGYVDAIVYLFDRETYHTPSILTYTRRTNPKIPIVILGTASHHRAPRHPDSSHPFETRGYWERQIQPSRFARWISCSLRCTAWQRS